MSRTQKKLEVVLENIEGLMNDELEICRRVVERVRAEYRAEDRDAVLADLSVLQDNRIHRLVGRRPYSLRMLRQIFEDIAFVDAVNFKALERQLIEGTGSADDAPEDAPENALEPDEDALSVEDDDETEPAVPADSSGVDEPGPDGEKP